MPENGFCRPVYSRLAMYLTLAGLLIAFDQWTKTLIVQSFELFSFRPVTPFFNLCHVRNTGAAFSFLSEAGGWQTGFFVLLALVVSVSILVFLVKRHGQTLFCLSLAFILGGALGNVIDRVCLGYVIDFLDFYWQGYHWPAFNVADIAICMGAFGVILDEVLKGRQQKSH